MAWILLERAARLHDAAGDTAARHRLRHIRAAVISGEASDCPDGNCLLSELVSEALLSEVRRFEASDLTRALGIT